MNASASTLTSTSGAAGAAGSLRAAVAGAAVPAQGGWYTRPGLPRAARPLRLVGHETDHGFCSVCGAVWPCARARRDQRLATDPFGPAPSGTDPVVPEP